MVMLRKDDYKFLDILAMVLRNEIWLYNVKSVWTLFEMWNLISSNIGHHLFILLIHDIVLYAKRISWFGYGWILLCNVKPMCNGLPPWIWFSLLHLIIKRICALNLKRNNFWVLKFYCDPNVQGELLFTYFGLNPII